MEMKYDQLIETFYQEPFFETADLLTLFEKNEAQLLPQLSRWINAGKLIQLRRGKYLLPEHYRKQAVHPFYLSNRLLPPSYVSLFTALAYYGLIPEDTPLIQAVTSRGTKNWVTPEGRFSYHHLKPERFFGYEKTRFGKFSQQSAFIASPEKALIDICLLNSGPWCPERWRGLRLQNSGQIQQGVLKRMAAKLPGPGLAASMNALIQVLEGLA